MIVNLEANEHISSILQNAELPHSDIMSANWFGLIGWLENDQLVGVAGMEHCGSAILLRSVAVKPEHQAKGLGRRLITKLHQKAAQNHHKYCYLLTLDMANYFKQQFQYIEIDRDNAPDDIVHSSQFTGVCPATATLMVKKLS